MAGVVLAVALLAFAVLVARRRKVETFLVGPLLAPVHLYPAYQLGELLPRLFAAELPARYNHGPKGA